MTTPLEIISLGLGVQSTALYYMCSMGEMPRVDYAIFSDLGREGVETYAYLDFLLDWQKKNDGIPIVVCKGKNLYSDLLNSQNSAGNRFAPIPAFTKGDEGIGMLRRQCTREYKIAVVDDAIRVLYGIKAGQRRPQTRVWLGITLDEMERMSIPQNAWKINYYPFVGYATSKKNPGFKVHTETDSTKTRADLYKWYNEKGLPIPPKSACVFCPYQSDARWYDMKHNQPEDFKAACMVDESIRDSTNKEDTHPAYLHNTCRAFARYTI